MPLSSGSTCSGAVSVEKRNIRQWQKILREEPDFTPYEDITPDTIRFIVAIEDYKFWKHRGINLSNIYYSAKHNIKRYLRIISRGDHSGDVRGGSTISQQLVKKWLNYVNLISEK